MTMNADEKVGLEDSKLLAAHRSKFITRRKLLVINAAYVSALAAVQPTDITKLPTSSSMPILSLRW